MYGPRQADRSATMALGVLWAVGGVVVLATLALPGWDDMRHPGLLTAEAAAAVAFGAVVSWGAHRRGWHMPQPAQRAAMAAGSVAVSFAAYFAGPESSVAFAGMYAFVATFAFLYFPLAAAVRQLAFAGVLYAVVLVAVGDTDVAQWAAVFGIATTGAALGGVVTRRARWSLGRERETAESLAEAERVRQAFLGPVGHELRTPLSVVVTYATVLERRIDRMDADAVRGHVATLGSAARDLNAMVADVLDLQRVQGAGAPGPDRRPTRVSEVVRRGCEPFEGRGVDVDRDAVEGYDACVDANRAERIVAVLVGHAVRHGGGAGRVRAAADALGRGGVRIVVEDDRADVDVGALDHLLSSLAAGSGAEAMQTTAGGVGLALASELARSHGGTVRCDRSPLGGARFVVELPGPDEHVERRSGIDRRSGVRDRRSRADRRQGGDRRATDAPAS